MKRNLFVVFLMAGVMTLLSSFTAETVTSDEQQVQKVSSGAQLVYIGGSASREDVTVTLVDDYTMVVEVHRNYINRLRIDWLTTSTRWAETWYSGDRIPLKIRDGEYVEVGVTKSAHPGDGRMLMYKLVYPTAIGK